MRRLLIIVVICFSTFSYSQSVDGVLKKVAQEYSDTKPLQFNTKYNLYKNISQKLAHAENISVAEATQMANEGKAVVWIDGGLHATEVVGIHQWIESIYQLITRTDDETKRILKSTIILFVHANPDGQELVSNWYMRNSDTLKRATSSLPRLYQKYIGHDNNRDFFMTNMSESKNMSRQQYIEWMPQILYNHHQTGPAGRQDCGGSRQYLRFRILVPGRYSPRTARRFQHRGQGVVG